MTREKYDLLSPDEKYALRAERQAYAIAAVKDGGFPGGIRVKVGDHTLTCRPVGMSDKGSVAYGHSPTVLQIGGRQVRINRLSFSVLAGAAVTTDEALEAAEVI